MPKRSDIKSILIIGAVISGLGAFGLLALQADTGSANGARIYDCPKLIDEAALEACAEENLKKLQHANAKPLPATVEQLRNAYQQFIGLPKNADGPEPLEVKLVRHQLGELLYYSVPEFAEGNNLPSDYSLDNLGALFAKGHLLSDGKYLAIFWVYNGPSQSAYQAVTLDSAGILQLLKQQQFKDKDQPFDIDTAYFNNPEYDEAAEILSDSSKSGYGTMYSTTYKLVGNLFELEKEVEYTTDYSAGDDAEIYGIEKILYERKP